MICILASSSYNSRIISRATKSLANDISLVATSCRCVADGSESRNFYAIN